MAGHSGTVVREHVDEDVGTIASVRGVTSGILEKFNPYRPAQTLTNERVATEAGSPQLLWQHQMFNGGLLPILGEHLGPLALSQQEWRCRR
jgi:hypothetical protein